MIKLLDEEKGKHFDPSVVGAFMAMLPRMLQVRDSYRDD